MTRASDSDVPTVRIRPQDSRLSAVFQVMTPILGNTSNAAAMSAGIAGESRWMESLSHKTDVSARIASVLISGAENGRGGVAAMSPAFPGSNLPTMIRSHSAPAKMSA